LVPVKIEGKLQNIDYTYRLIHFLTPVLLLYKKEL
jgi:hypothetical protein